MRPTLGNLLQVNQSRNWVAPGPLTTCLVKAEASITPTPSRIALASSTAYCHQPPRLMVEGFRRIQRAEIVRTLKPVDTAELRATRLHPVITGRGAQWTAGVT